MNGPGLIAILPLIMLAAAAVAVMLAIAWRRHHGIAAGLTALSLVAALASLLPAAVVAPRQVTPLLAIDSYALFFIGLFLAAALCVTALAHGFFAGRQERPEEFHLLVLIGTLGAAVLAAADHVASFVLGLETLSIALFVLIAYPLPRERPLEAGLKYLVLTGIASAFLLFGLALVYAGAGRLSFAGLGSAAGAMRGLYLPAGLVLALVGIGFKLSIVPFHMWAPDVYEGAPAPATAFLATVSKGAVLVLLLRFVLAAGGEAAAPLPQILAVIAAASMLTGNLLALRQENVKRLLAYSSIAHLGYLLIAVLAAGRLGAEAAGVYIVAYMITTLGAFGVVSLASEGMDDGSGRETIADYRGLFRSRPWLAAVFTAMLLSLAGIPLTMGFIAKFYAIAAGAGAALWALVIILVAGSAIGLFYYLRLIFALFADEDAVVPAAAAGPSLQGRLTLAALTGLLVILGIYPAPLIEVVRLATAALL